MSQNYEEDLGAFGVVEQTELESSCKEHDIPYELLARSLQVEFSLSRRNMMCCERFSVAPNLTHPRQ